MLWWWKSHILPAILLAILRIFSSKFISTKSLPKKNIPKSGEIKICSSQKKTVVTFGRKSGGKKHPLGRKQLPKAHGKPTSFGSDDFNYRPLPSPQLVVSWVGPGFSGCHRLVQCHDYIPLLKKFKAFLSRWVSCSKLLGWHSLKYWVVYLGPIILGLRNNPYISGADYTTQPTTLLVTAQVNLWANLWGWWPQKTTSNKNFTHPKWTLKGFKNHTTKCSGLSFVTCLNSIQVSVQTLQLIFQLPIHQPLPTMKHKNCQVEQVKDQSLVVLFWVWFRSCPKHSNGGYWSLLKVGPHDDFCPNFAGFRHAPKYNLHKYL